MGNHLLFIAGSDIDYFYEVEAFLNKGDACMAKSLGSKIGGCVLNAASVCAKLGSTVKVLDYLKKDDEGTNLLLQGLQKNNVDISPIQLDANVTNGTCLIMKKGDEKCIYVIPPKKPFFNENQEMKNLLENSSFIYSLMDIIKSSFVDLSIIKAAKKKGSKIIFDGGSQYQNFIERDILLELADGLFINHTAYERLQSICSFNPVEYLLNQGCEFICITNGSKGADCYTKEGIYHEESKKIEVVDSTGAGDSFAGSFLHFLNKVYGKKECLKLASYHGAYACTKQGGMSAAIDENELFKFINNYNHSISKLL